MPICFTGTSLVLRGSVVVPLLSGFQYRKPLEISCCLARSTRGTAKYPQTNSAVCQTPKTLLGETINRISLTFNLHFILNKRYFSSVFFIGVTCNLQSASLFLLWWKHLSVYCNHYPRYDLGSRMDGNIQCPLPPPPSPHQPTLTLKRFWVVVNRALSHVARVYKVPLGLGFQHPPPKRGSVW